MVKALGLKLLTVVLKVVVVLRRRRITITTNMLQTILYPKHVRRAYHFRAHKWLVHPRPQSAEISADCGDFGCPRDNTSYTLDTCSDDLKKLHMAQKTRFERAAKYEPYIAAFDYPDA